jgi:hypothetical protein
MNERIHVWRDRAAVIPEHSRAMRAKQTLQQRIRQEHIDEGLDESLEQSFPASDPPSWTTPTKIGSPK